MSRTTLIRLVRALPDPALSASPRVLGDEFALRKGRRYRTLLVDVETCRPADILEDRSAGSFSAWLAARPGAQGLGGRPICGKRLAARIISAPPGADPSDGLPGIRARS